jgi:hypothetical protein
VEPTIILSILRSFTNIFTSLVLAFIFYLVKDDPLTSARPSFKSPKVDIFMEGVFFTIQISADSSSLKQLLVCP